jgi:hypothetical protein
MKQSLSSMVLSILAAAMLAIPATAQAAPAGTEAGITVPLPAPSPID